MEHRRTYVGLAAWGLRWKVPSWELLLPDAMSTANEPERSCEVFTSQIRVGGAGAWPASAANASNLFFCFFSFLPLLPPRLGVISCRESQNSVLAEVVITLLLNVSRSQDWS